MEGQTDNFTPIRTGITSPPSRGQIHPRGTNSPLGDNFAPGGQSLPLGEKLRMGLRAINKNLPLSVFDPDCTCWYFSESNSDILVSPEDDLCRSKMSCANRCGGVYDPTVTGDALCSCDEDCRFFGGDFFLGGGRLQDECGNDFPQKTNVRKIVKLFNGIFLRRKQ
jgi:hypothetical protein